MQHPAKSEFLRRYGFPTQWEEWGTYPDDLFQGQLAATIEDAEPCPDEHLRYGAFCWWVRRHRELSEEKLIQLCRLAALDPDPPMAGAAVHDILFHPMATDRVAVAVADLAEGHEGWRTWFVETDKRRFFRELLDKGRAFWVERESVHRVALDLQEARLSEQELRTLYAAGGALVLRGLVEHSKIPADLLRELAKLQGVRFAKAIRSLAEQRLSGKTIAATGFAEKYSTDPWLWPR
jgi:hypothetical protein